MTVGYQNGMGRRYRRRRAPLTWPLLFIVWAGMLVSNQGVLADVTVSVMIAGYAAYRMRLHLRRRYRHLMRQPPRHPMPRFAQPPVITKPSRSIPQAVKVAVAARDGGRCVLCGSTQDIQFGHKIPWSWGGPATVDNIQLECGRCNRAKGARV